MLTEDVVMTEIRVTRLLAFLLAMAVMAVSCGSDPEAKVASSSPATDLAVAEPDDSEDSSGIELDDPHNLRFDPTKWDEIPDWWLEIQDVPFDRLWRPQSTQRIETPPSDHQYQASRSVDHECPLEMTKWPANRQGLSHPTDHCGPQAPFELPVLVATWLSPRQIDRRAQKRWSSGHR